MLIIVMVVVMIMMLLIGRWIRVVMNLMIWLIWLVERIRGVVRGEVNVLVIYKMLMLLL